jgi:hypothetical protein|tara:strand:+ start:3359 stop:3460 length:102 start_codon:yes stop_codon:yes gene_type:complete
MVNDETDLRRRAPSSYGGREDSAREMMFCRHGK